MCSPARCRNCSKTTWSGCGSHVDQVMRDVPKAQRCSCTPDERASSGGGFLSRMLGR